MKQETHAKRPTVKVVGPLQEEEDESRNAAHQLHSPLRSVSFEQNWCWCVRKMYALLRAFSSAAEILPDSKTETEMPSQLSAAGLVLMTWMGRHAHAHFVPVDPWPGEPHKAPRLG